MKIKGNSSEDKAGQDLTDDEYQSVFKKTPRLCLDFVIVQQGNVLLAKRDIEPYKGCWSLPGGRVRYKESIDQAADRILMTELHCKPLLKRLLGYGEFLNDGPWLHSVSLVFEAVLESEEISGSSQAHDIKFFASIPEDVHPVQGKFLKENWYSVVTAYQPLTEERINEAWAQTKKLFS